MFGTNVSISAGPDGVWAADTSAPIFGPAVRVFRIRDRCPTLVATLGADDHGPLFYEPSVSVTTGGVFVAFRESMADVVVYRWNAPRFERVGGGVAVGLDLQPVISGLRVLTTASGTWLLNPAKSSPSGDLVLRVYQLQGADWVRRPDLPANRSHALGNRVATVTISKTPGSASDVLTLYDFSGPRPAELVSTRCEFCSGVVVLPGAAPFDVVVAQQSGPGFRLRPVRLRRQVVALPVLAEPRVGFSDGFGAVYQPDAGVIVAANACVSIDAGSCTDTREVLSMSVDGSSWLELAGGSVVALDEHNDVMVGSLELTAQTVDAGARGLAVRPLDTQLRFRWP